MAKISEERQSKLSGIGSLSNSSKEDLRRSSVTVTKETSEQLTHGERVKKGQLASVQQGRYGTGPAPYGYRRGGPGEKPLVIDDYEAEIVRMIFREYVRTKSTGKVVEYLHSKGIYTRQGKKWSRQAISIILSNRTYRGRVCFGGIEAEGLHDPIVDAALFYKANAIRQSRSKSKKDSGKK
ncbi:MAG: recombinase family protein [Candidatus Hydrogenedentes bacterium]|nr:recombinase family protein [Candidatus Hydrogenedentota bacterium]